MGVTVLVPEREHAGELFWKNGMLGRRGVFTPAVEAFYRRGLLKKVVGGGQRPAHFENTDKFQFGRHLAGMMLNANQIDFSRWKHRLAGPSFMSGATTLGKLEAVLSERAESLNVQILRVMGVHDIVGEGQMELQFASTYTDRSKQATEYRRGRVLLAGDSVHIHSPLGAQGLNTGIGDAIKLGWKLATVIKGDAPAGLLDTYHEERHPEAAKVLEWTRAQVVTLSPERSACALASIVNDLIQTDEGATYFADRIWGLLQRYDFGGAHPLVGCSAPAFQFADAERLGSRLEDACFAVIDFAHDSSVARCVESLRPMGKYCGSHAYETFGLKTLLVRSDGVVAWASEDNFDPEPMKMSLSQWLTLPVTIAGTVEG
ncbi:MAG: hypothetical protein FE78DRAFT_31464 [Acidomyces sp. 'richmondensis']|nr:MAG: hypothetical protein FE78DRAFT_31464 [Acidomyces sp. 'richmondensis']